MSKRKKIFHKPEEQVPSADDILNYLNEESAAVPPPLKSSPAPSASAKKNKKMESEEVSSENKLSEINEEVQRSSMDLSLDNFSISKEMVTGGGDSKKNKKKYELEKSMLSEPLVSDAVEGYALMGDRKRAGTLIEEINRNISSQTSRKNNRGALMRIAAILLLVLMVSGGSFYIFEEWSGVTMNAESKQKADYSSSFQADTIALANKDTIVPGQLAIEMEMPMQEQMDKTNVNAVHSDASIAPAPVLQAPLKEEAERSRGENENVAVVSAADEFVQKDDVAPTMNQWASDSVVLKENQVVIISKKELAYNTYQFKESKKSTESAKDRRAKQKGEVVKAPASSRTEVESLSEEGKPSGAIKKNYLLEDGIRLYNEGKYTEAKEIFEGVLLTQSSNQEAIFYRGMSDYRTKAYDPALADLARILPVSRRYDEARWNMSLIYAETGRKEQAVSLWKELSKTNNSYSEQAFQKLKEYTK